MLSSFFEPPLTRKSLVKRQAKSGFLNKERIMVPLTRDFLVKAGLRLPALTRKSLVKETRTHLNKDNKEPDYPVKVTC